MEKGSEAGIPAAKDAGIPSAKPVGSTGAPAADVAVALIASDHRVTITSDVLTLSLDGGNVFDAQLLQRSEEHTSELQSLMRNSYDVFCLKNKKTQNYTI